MRRGSVSKCTYFEGGNEYFHPAKHSADPQKVLGLSSGGDGITQDDWMPSPKVYNVPADCEQQQENG